MTSGGASTTARPGSQPGRARGSGEGGGAAPRQAVFPALRPAPRPTPPADVLDRCVKPSLRPRRAEPAHSGARGGKMTGGPPKPDEYRLVTKFSRRILGQ